MTGKFQSSTGMVINELRLSPEHECFGPRPARSGYQTAYIGKWHMWANEFGHHDLTRTASSRPVLTAWASTDSGLPTISITLTSTRLISANATTRQIRKHIEPDADRHGDRISSGMPPKKPEPFALFLSWGPPHDPWGWDNVSPEYADMFRNVTLPGAPNFSDQPDPYADKWATLPNGLRDRNCRNFCRIITRRAANIDWNVGRCSTRSIGRDWREHHRRFHFRPRRNVRLPRTQGKIHFL